MAQKSIVLSIRNLKVQRSKSFCLSVEDIKLQKGSVTCLVGANGSGKTTLIKTIAGLIPSHAGSIAVGGIKATNKNRLQINKIIGYVPDDDAWIIPELTAHEFFSLLVDVYQGASFQRINQLCKELDFKSSQLRLGSLSHGNKKKVQLIAALAHQPRLLVVDELRNGLDPIIILRAEELLKDFVNKGGAILASSHDLWWAERFADSTLMIHEGKIKYSGSTAQIVNTYGSLEEKFKQVYARND